jgi:DHA1 family tetracycline resistance protein-like MFS transporter
LAHFVLQSTFVLYASHRYGWTPKTVGLALAGVGICSFVVQGGLVRPVVAKLGERRALMLGLALGAIGLAGYGLAPTGLHLWIALPIVSLWGFAGPSAQALMSKETAPSNQGKLQGGVASIMAVAGIIGPGIYTTTFAWGIAPAVAMPGLPFFVAAALLALAVPLAALVTRAAGNRHDPPVS